MLMGEQAETGSAGGGAWAELLDRHRGDWVASLAAGRPMVWVDDYGGGGDRDAVRDAAAEGRPVVLGLPADARGEAEREADRLAAELGGVRVTQHLAAGSLIGPDGDAGGDAVHFLVCVNVEPSSSSMTDADVVPLMTRYVRLFKEALAEQREIATQAKAALEAPRYRAVDKVRDFVFAIPGLSALFRLRSRLIQRRRG